MEQLLDFPVFEKEIKISIKTMSGEMLYEQKIKKNKSFNWNGITFKNEKIKPGSYIYILEEGSGERQLGLFSIDS